MVLAMPISRTPQRATNSQSAPLATRRASVLLTVASRMRGGVARFGADAIEIGGERSHGVEEARQNPARRSGAIVKGRSDRDERRNRIAAGDDGARLDQLRLGRAGGDGAVDDVEIPNQPRVGAVVD